MNDSSPVSLATAAELQRVLAGRYRLIAAARRWLIVIAVLVAVGGLLELFSPFVLGGSDSLYDTLTSLAVVFHLCALAGRVFALLVAAQVLQLMLDVAKDVEEMREADRSSSSRV